MWPFRKKTSPTDDDALIDAEIETPIIEIDENGVEIVVHPPDRLLPRILWRMRRRAKAQLALAEIIIHDAPYPERYTLPLSEAQEKLPRDAMYHVRTTGSSYGHLIVAGILGVMGVLAFMFLGGMSLSQTNSDEPFSVLNLAQSIGGIVLLGCWGMGGLAFFIMPKYMAGRITLPKYYVDSDGNAIVPFRDRSDEWAEFMGEELARAQADGSANEEIVEGVDYGGMLERRVETLRSGRTDPPYSPYMMGQIEDMEAAQRFFTLQENMRSDKGGGILKMGILLGITIFGVLVLNGSVEQEPTFNPNPPPTTVPTLEAPEPTNYPDGYDPDADRPT